MGADNAGIATRERKRSREITGNASNLWLSVFPPNREGAVANYLQVSRR
jgi:hypothetical protein